MVYAIDFDGTLAYTEYPHIIRMNLALIEWIKQRQKEGDKFILWTCRENEYLRKALNRCAEHGLYFDAVNDNLPENIAEYGSNPRKVHADVYVDDRNIPADLKGYEFNSNVGRLERIGERYEYKV